MSQITRRLVHTLQRLKRRVLRSKSETGVHSMTQEEVAAWERMWNGTLAHSDDLRVHTKLIPPGSHFINDAHTADDPEMPEYVLGIDSGGTDYSTYAQAPHSTAAPQ